MCLCVVTCSTQPSARPHFTPADLHTRCSFACMCSSSAYRRRQLRCGGTFQPCLPRKHCIKLTCHAAPLACEPISRLLTLRTADIVDWARNKRQRTHHTGVTVVPQSVQAWFPRATLLYGRRMLLLRLRLSSDCKLSTDITLPGVGKLAAREDDCKLLSGLSGRRRFASSRLETRAGMPTEPTASALVNEGLAAPAACTSTECCSAAPTGLLAVMTAVTGLVDKNTHKVVVGTTMKIGIACCSRSAQYWLSWVDSAVTNALTLCPTLVVCLREQRWRWCSKSKSLQ